jgi:alpha-glucoside transport system substrate-binding protein
LWAPADGAFRGADQTDFEGPVKMFEAGNPGMAVEFGGTEQSETVISMQGQAGSTSDVTSVWQSGLIAKLRQMDGLVPVHDDIAALYNTNYCPASKTLATINGKIYGMFSHVNAKGLVYYNKPLFDAKGN